VTQLGRNADGEVLVSGRVPGRYLGLRLDPPGHTEAAGVLVVAPAALLHPAVPQPDGTVLYELVTGHPDRAPCELVFLADLTVELRAWPRDTWTKVGVDPQATAAAVCAGGRRGDLPGLRLGGLTAQEALALERPAMTYVRARLGDRLQRQLAHAWRRWRHQTSGRLAGDRFLQQRTPAGGGVRSGHPAIRTPAAVPEAPDIGPCRSVQFRRQPDTARGCGVRGGQRPSGQHLAACPDLPRTLPRCAVARTPAGVAGQVGAADRHRRSGRAWTADGLWTQTPFPPSAHRPAAPP
jgi:hypothetical protein